MAKIQVGDEAEGAGETTTTLLHARTRAIPRSGESAAAPRTRPTLSDGDLVARGESRLFWGRPLPRT